MSFSTLSDTLSRYFLPPSVSNVQFDLNSRDMADIMSRKDLKQMVPQPKVYKRAPYTVEVPGAKKVSGETIPRRNIRNKDSLQVVPEEGVETIWDVVKRSSKKFGNAKALGKRKLVQMHEETKKVKKVVDGKEEEVDKKWSYYELSPYEYMSFVEYEKLVLQIGSGLRHLGMQAQDRVHIFAATHPYWLAMAHGSGSQSMPIVTAYDTLGEEGLKPFASADACEGYFSGSAFAYATHQTSARSEGYPIRHLQRRRSSYFEARTRENRGRCGKAQRSPPTPSCTQLQRFHQNG